VDVIYLYRGLRFVWNAEKAQSNITKHGTAFEEACEVFFDPLYSSMDATDSDEERQAAIGLTTNRRLLVVVHLLIQGNHIRIISARKATAQERSQYEDDSRTHS
jgi:uncharacterized DUF497 family protein